MPVFALPEQFVFPHPSLAEPDGLLAIGGDLQPGRLLAAYRQGIFPWYNRKPVLWWSPDPRCVFFPHEFKAPKSLLQIIRKDIFEIRMDTCFEQVIHHCATVKRKGEKGTWITPDVRRAYCTLHEMGFAHSVETFYESRLVGGLYGVSLGGTFFGESMFHLLPNASKVALFYLIDFCLKNNITLIDNQVTSSHLLRLGAREISRQDFLLLLQKNNQQKTLQGKWKVAPCSSH